MPELPDVEGFKRYLDSTALHKKIADVDVRNTKVLKRISGPQLKKALTGNIFQSTRRHGKYLFVELHDGAWLLLHFGMTGFLRYYKVEDGDLRHARILFDFTNGYHLAYVCQRMLGRVTLVDDAKQYAREHGLGPDALTISLSAFKEAAQGKSKAVKSLLMDQAVFAGIGNVYSDEMLYQAGVHPKTKTGALSDRQLNTLHTRLRIVLRTAIRKKANPGALPRSWLLPHRKEGEACPRCGGIIATVKMTGRTSYYCPDCQKEQS